jgi:hypothetical protein
LASLALAIEGADELLEASCGVTAAEQTPLMVARRLR